MFLELGDELHDLLAVNGVGEHPVKRPSQRSFLDRVAGPAVFLDALDDAVEVLKIDLDFGRPREIDERTTSGCARPVRIRDARLRLALPDLLRMLKELGEVVGVLDRLFASLLYDGVEKLRHAIVIL